MANALPEVKYTGKIIIVAHPKKVRWAIDLLFDSTNPKIGFGFDMEWHAKNNSRIALIQLCTGWYLPRETK